MNIYDVPRKSFMTTGNIYFWTATIRQAQIGIFVMILLNITILQPASMKPALIILHFFIIWMYFDAFYWFVKTRTKAGDSNKGREFVDTH